MNKYCNTFRIKALAILIVVFVIGGNKNSSSSSGNAQTAGTAGTKNTGSALAAVPETDFTFDEATGTITKYTGWETSIAIPTAIGGKAVTAIRTGAFEDAGLTSVAIPNDVRVEWNAFRGNKLTALTLGKGVDIVRSAFYGNQLTSVTFGADCRISRGEDFGYFAFFSYMCNNRKAGTYKIDAEWDRNWISSNSRDYEKVRKTAEGYTYAETPYGLAITDHSAGAGRLSVPDTLNGKPVKYIGGVGGIGKGLTGIRIPDSVVAIADSTFSEGSLPSGAFIGNGVTFIGNRAFDNCELTSVTLPASVVYIGVDAFRGNELTSVTIPNSVTYIGNNAFTGNKLTSITLPANVSLGENGFKSAYESNGKKAGTYSLYNGRWGLSEEIQRRIAVDQTQKAEAEEASRRFYEDLTRMEELKTMFYDLLHQMDALGDDKIIPTTEAMIMGSNEFNNFVEWYKLYQTYKKLLEENSSEGSFRDEASIFRRTLNSKRELYLRFLSSSQKKTFEEQFGEIN